MKPAPAQHCGPLPESVTLAEYVAMLEKVPGAVEAEVGGLIRAISDDNARRRIIRAVEREEISAENGEQQLREMGLPGLSEFALGGGL